MNSKQLPLFLQTLLSEGTNRPVYYLSAEEGAEMPFAMFQVINGPEGKPYWEARVSIYVQAAQKVDAHDLAWDLHDHMEKSLGLIGGFKITRIICDAPTERAVDYDLFEARFDARILGAM